MRWTRGGKRERPTGDLPIVRHSWADRLEALGRVLDESGVTLRDVAVSITGEMTWLCARAWFQGRIHSGWSVVALRLEGDRLVLVEPGAPPLDRTVGDNARSPWGPRLRAIGLLLDRSATLLTDPSIIEVDDGFVVTVLTGMDASRGSRTPLSREFGPADLEAALAAEQAG